MERVTVRRIESYVLYRKPPSTTSIHFRTSSNLSEQYPRICSGPCRELEREIVAYRPMWPGTLRRHIAGRTVQHRREGTSAIAD
jgi:hypothetical protein